MNFIDVTFASTQSPILSSTTEPLRYCFVGYIYFCIGFMSFIYTFYIVRGLLLWFYHDEKKIR